MKKITIAAIVACALCAISCNDKAQEYTEVDMGEMEFSPLAYEDPLPFYKTRTQSVEVECAVRDFDEIIAHPERFIDFALSFTEKGTKSVNLRLTGAKNMTLSAHLEYPQRYIISLSQIECVSSDDGYVSYSGEMKVLSIRKYQHDNLMVYVPQSVMSYYTL